MSEERFVSKRHVNDHVPESLILLNALDKGLDLHVVRVCILFGSDCDDHAYDVCVDVFHNEERGMTVTRRSVDGCLMHDKKTEKLFANLVFKLVSDAEPASVPVFVLPHVIVCVVIYVLAFTLGNNPGFFSLNMFTAASLAS